MEMQDGVSFIVPAYNEERSLRDTVDVIKTATNKIALSYEIIIINDGSSDATPQIADVLSQENQFVKTIHHDCNKGLGAAYKTGLSNVCFQYVMLVPGDNVWPADALVSILARKGEADIVIPYIKSAGDKTPFRKFLSSGYTFIINMLFRLKVPYYNGIVLHKTNIIKSISIDTDHFSYQTEALVKLLKMGYGFVSVEACTLARCGGKSTALKFRNMIAVAKTILSLIKRVYFSQRIFQ